MQNKKIIVKGAKANNLKNIDLEIPRDSLLFLRDFQARENPRLRLIRFTQRDRGDISNRFLRMQGNF